MSAAAKKESPHLVPIQFKCLAFKHQFWGRFAGNANRRSQSLSSQSMMMHATVDDKLWSQLHYQEWDLNASTACRGFISKGLLARAAHAPIRIQHLKSLKVAVSLCELLLIINNTMMAQPFTWSQLRGSRSKLRHESSWEFLFNGFISQITVETAICRRCCQHCHRQATR